MKILGCAARYWESAVVPHLGAPTMKKLGRVTLAGMVVARLAKIQAPHSAAGWALHRPGGPAGAENPAATRPTDASRGRPPSPPPPRKVLTPNDINSLTALEDRLREA